MVKSLNGPGPTKSCGAVLYKYSISNPADSLLPSPKSLYHSHPPFSKRLRTPFKYLLQPAEKQFVHPCFFEPAGAQHPAFVSSAGLPKNLHSTHYSTALRADVAYISVEHPYPQRHVSRREYDPPDALNFRQSKKLSR